MRIAHVAFEFGARDEGGDGVDDHNINGIGADQRFGDFERLLAVVGLRDEEIIDIHAELARVGGIERVFGVDEGGLAAEFLRFGDHVQRERRLAARFRAVDFDDAAARQAADAESSVNRDGAGGNHVHRDEHVAVPQAHDRAFAVLLFNLCDCQIQILRFFVGHACTSRAFRRHFLGTQEAQSTRMHALP